MIVLLHSITGILTTKGVESTNDIALHGMGRIASFSTISIMNMVGCHHNADTPKEGFLVKNLIPSNVTTPDGINGDDTEPMSIIDGIQIPPWLTKDVNAHGWTAAKDSLLCVLKKSKKEVETITKEDGTSAEDDITFIDEVDVPHSTLLCHLFV